MFRLELQVLIGAGPDAVLIIPSYKYRAMVAFAGPMMIISDARNACARSPEASIYLSTVIYSYNAPSKVRRNSQALTGTGEY